MKEGTIESHMCRGIRALAKAVFGPDSAADRNSVDTINTLLSR
jgi:hypothetical protein